MEKNEKISVVVPIYNVEEYLPRCLDSIIAQTYSNIEILLVDDGSPDNAGAICDAYADKDKRIRVFHIPNGGVAKARQYGVENSTGEYIVFVDPDDWLPLNSIEALCNAMSPEADIIIGSYKIIFNKKARYVYFSSTTLYMEDYIRYILLSKITHSPWGKLYRKSLFQADSFPCAKKGQDLLMNIGLSVKVNKVRILNNLVYNYFQRSNSSVKLNNSDFNYEKQISDHVIQILLKENLYNYFLNEITKFKLMRMYYVIIANSKLLYNDIWVEDVIHSSEKIDLALKEKIVLFCLRYPRCTSMVSYALKIGSYIKTLINSK